MKVSNGHHYSLTLSGEVNRIPDSSLNIQTPPSGGSLTVLGLIISPEETPTALELIIHPQRIPTTLGLATPPEEILTVLNLTTSPQRTTTSLNLTNTPEPNLAITPLRRENSTIEIPNAPQAFRGIDHYVSLGTTAINLTQAHEEFEMHSPDSTLEYLIRIGNPVVTPPVRQNRFHPILLDSPSFLDFPPQISSDIEEIATPAGFSNTPNYNDTYSESTTETIEDDFPFLANVTTLFAEFSPTSDAEHMQTLEAADSVQELNSQNELKKKSILKKSREEYERDLIDEETTEDPGKITDSEDESYFAPPPSKKKTVKFITEKNHSKEEATSSQTTELSNDENTPPNYTGECDEISNITAF